MGSLSEGRDSKLRGRSLKIIFRVTFKKCLALFDKKLLRAGSPQQRCVREVQRTTTPCLHRFLGLHQGTPYVTTTLQWAYFLPVLLGLGTVHCTIGYNEFDFF